MREPVPTLRAVNRDTLLERYASAEWDMVDCEDGILRPFTDSPTPVNYGLITVVPKAVLVAERTRSREAETAIREVIDGLDNGNCGFWACPGPDAPMVGMATCSKCWAIKQLRALCGGDSE